MKRLACLFLVICLLAAFAGGCGRKKDNNTPTEPTTPTTPTDPTGDPAVRENGALKILKTVWDSYGEDEKFAVIGGDPDNMVDGAPGDFSLEDPEAVTYSLVIPAELVSQVDEAASLVHGMLSNNFTCGVVHLKDGTDTAVFTQSLYEAVQNSRWMCGMPERVMVAVVEGDYVLMAYGLEAALSLFQSKLTEAYPNTQIAYNAAITG